MGNYSDRLNSVRVDFFKDSLKWYATEAVVWPDHDYRNPHLDLAFALALRAALQMPDPENGGAPTRLRYTGMIAVCLEPYNEHGYPFALRVDDVYATIFEWGACLAMNALYHNKSLNPPVIKCPRCHRLLYPLAFNHYDRLDAICQDGCGWEGEWRRPCSLTIEDAP